MAKRDLTPGYRAGAEAFAKLLADLGSINPDCIYFYHISAALLSAVEGKSAEWISGFYDALGLFIEEAGGPGTTWSPMRDLEDPDWWYEEDPAGGSDAQA
ncbi:hypothetical protein [Burkholderia gladioli]|uniref:hypothetical protein n=1 Tax=Burkholderia gladioli TaxID=28095 RepID=UPI0034DB158D